LVETEALDWTRAGEIWRAPVTVRQQLIGEVLSSGETARTRMTTLKIRRRRGRELDGSQCSTPVAKTLRSVLASLAAVGALQSDDERRVLEQIGDEVDRLRGSLTGQTMAS